ncbi:50S ribosomal protein L23 [Candidatus Uzinura diaspidicola str. ASNER]|uniref:50S ribosomal protein L23 n=1 Tax=Candidatus Uzinura diaspidicola str. ASNER TaxID=1133592 RepID=L7VJP8_9FLAO|nr:50S ribosomal protein L23 [Candidatus Uzinura diaspidicola str. ASNER]
MIYFIKSIITEKSLSIKELKNIYTFLFHYKANKLNIKKEIEKRFNVTVKTVRTMILLIKKMRKKNSNNNYSKYRKIKKVFIELKEGQYIEV